MIKLTKNFQIILLSIFCIGSFLGCAQTNQELKYIHARDSNFQFVGRHLKLSNGDVQFALPGASVYGAFEGSYLDVVVKEFGAGKINSTNYLTIVVDDLKPYTIKLNPMDTIYSVSNSLSLGRHSFQIVKRTESLVGVIEFRGIQILKKSTFTKNSNIPKTKLLFIGNSITCGYGNDTSIAVNPSSFTSKNENNYNSFGHLAARALKAQYMAFAYSGRGLYKNIDGTTQGVIPGIFDRVFPDDAKYTWDHTLYVPDIIVVNLGTNDFSSETNGKGKIDSAIFVNKYLTFVARLKQLYPSSKIILAVGSMMSDAYPANGKHWSRIQAYVSSVVNIEKESGNKSIGYLKFEPQTAPYGEDWHPSFATHQKMADQLVNFINTTITHVQSNDTEEEILLAFPNPAKDFVVVKNFNKKYKIEIYDSKGNLLISKNGDKNEIKIDLQSLPKGSYILKNYHSVKNIIIE